MYHHTPAQIPVVLFVLTGKVMDGQGSHPETLVALPDVNVLHVDDGNEGGGPHDQLQGGRGHEVPPPGAVRSEEREWVLLHRNTELKVEITEDFAVIETVSAA